MANTPFRPRPLRLCQTRENPFNGLYQFANATSSAKIVPFATAGVSGLFSADGVARAYNFGGGVNYWLSDRTGLRFEVRDHVFEYSQLYEFRVAFAFRGRK